MHMPEEGRQHGQAPLDILARAVPPQQRFNCESMAKVVQARSVAVIQSAQSNSP